MQWLGSELLVMLKRDWEEWNWYAQRTWAMADRLGDFARSDHWKYDVSETT